MSGHEDDQRLTPLAPEAQQILNAERRRQAPAGAQDRVRARLGVTLGLGLPGTPAEAASTSSTAAAGAASSGGVAIKVVGSVVMASLLLGGVMTQRTRTVSERPAAPRAVMFAPLAAAPAAPVSHATPHQAAARMAPPRRVQTSIKRAASPRRVEDSLQDERAILDGARAHLAERHWDSALQSLEQHHRAHANGQLSQERDAMVIMVLHRTGQTVEARLKMEDFRRQHPNSIFLPGVSATLDGR